MPAREHPGTGGGIGGAGDGEVGTLTIQDATVHTYGGQQFHHPTPIVGGGTNSIQAGADGSITNSTVYCYTGDTLDKTVTYDASGNGTEQSQ